MKYLTYIPVDYLKLDKSIIDSYLSEEAEEKNSFIRDIIFLAHDLGKKIVVEGWKPPGRLSGLSLSAAISFRDITTPARYHRRS